MNKTVTTASGMTFEINENVWTGKVSIFADGKETKKINKKVYVHEVNDQKFTIEKKGNSLFGMTLNVNGESVEVYRKLNPLEIIISLVPAFLVILGGAIGGLLGALAIILNIFTMRSTENWFIKVLEPIAVSVAAYYMYVLIVSMLFPVA